MLNLFPRPIQRSIHHPRFFSDAAPSGSGPSAASTGAKHAATGAKHAATKGGGSVLHPVEWLASRPGTVKESQELFLKSAAPTFLKRKSDKYLFGTMMGLVGVGLVLWGHGLYSMALGKNKKE